ncbi:MAG: gamma-glutamylcyclotransferase family protein [Pseudomonadota bacterium]
MTTDGNTGTFLFVYGTLRRDAGWEMGQELVESTAFIGDGFFQGLLYMVDGYPGVVPSADPRDVVHGEVYRLHCPADTLARLDRYEEYDPESPTTSEFIRVMKKVGLADGNTVNAWIYLYNHPVDTLTPITSGDFPPESTKIMRK